MLIECQPRSCRGGALVPPLARASLTADEALRAHGRPRRALLLTNVMDKHLLPVYHGRWSGAEIVELLGRCRQTTTLPAVVSAELL
jgi:hypothetical protein